MENKVCLDSDFLIGLWRKKKESLQWAEQAHECEFATTVVNIFELYYGEYKNPSEDGVVKLDKFLSRLLILELDPEIAKKAGENMAFLEKSGEMLEFRDVLIGTIAEHNGYSIKTNNKKHFERIPGLKIV